MVNNYSSNMIDKKGMGDEAPTGVLLLPMVVVQPVLSSVLAEYWSLC